jgi:short-subunit dehydrogenase
MPHTAYASAKFAVKGFSEALIEDFRVNAPHVKVAVVMPGHIGTDIIANSRRVLGGPEPDDMSADDIAVARVQMGNRGMPVQAMSDDDIRGMMKMLGEGFKSTAPVSAAQAATIILDAVKAGKWRILVGDDAHRLDEVVRANPEDIYGEGGIGLSTLMQTDS